MKFDVDDKNRCRLVCVKFHLNRRRFAVAVAKCLGSSLFWDTVYIHREAEKRNRFSFMDKSFNMQCNLTKFSTLIVNEYYHRRYLFIFWNLHKFSQITMQKV